MSGVEKQIERLFEDHPPKEIADALFAHLVSNMTSYSANKFRKALNKNNRKWIKKYPDTEFIFGTRKK